MPLSKSQTNRPERYSPVIFVAPQICLFRRFLPHSVHYARLSSIGIISPRHCKGIVALAEQTDREERHAGRKEGRKTERRKTGWASVMHPPHGHPPCQ